MLASEQREGVSITTGITIRVTVAGGDPLPAIGRGRLQRRHRLSLPVVPVTTLALLVSLTGTTGYLSDTLRVFRLQPMAYLPSEVQMPPNV